MNGSIVRPQSRSTGELGTATGTGTGAIPVSGGALPSGLRAHRLKDGTETFRACRLRTTSGSFTMPDAVSIASSTKSVAGVMSRRRWCLDLLARKKKWHL